MAARGSRRLETALEALVAALRSTRAPWMIIGGIAVAARGVRRMTADIDAAVRGDAVAITRLLRALARHAIVPRIGDAAAFAEANLVLLVRHTPSGVDLDVSLAWSAFEHEALAAATTAPFGRVRARIARAEDLVVLKAVAGRPKDLEDIEALLVLHPAMDVARLRSQIQTLAELAGAPQLVRAFDRAASRARLVAAKRR